MKTQINRKTNKQKNGLSDKVKYFRNRKKKISYICVVSFLDSSSYEKNRITKFLIVLICSRPHGSWHGKVIRILRLIASPSQKKIKCLHAKFKCSNIEFLYTLIDGIKLPAKNLFITLDCIL